MRRVILLCSMLSVLWVKSYAQKNWSEHIAPILYNKCSPCHHNGGAGHSDFTDYNTATIWSSAIQNATVQYKMPPWPPDINYRRYAHERVLSPQEINDIQDWVNSGTLLGDTNLLPPKPVYSGSSMLTIPPDFVFQMPNYTITQTGTGDIYWNFAIPTNFTQDYFIKGLEFLPGNTEYVHHCLIYVDTSGQALADDLAYPGPGYPGFGGVGSPSAQLIGAYVPGQQPFLFPQGFGFKLPQNSVIIFNMHYPVAGIGEMDSSKVHLFLTPGTPREVFIAPPLTHSPPSLQNGPLYIPANSTKTFYSKYTTPANFSVFGVMPHMHLIGRSIKSFGVTSTNDTIPFIHIPDWQFEWQGSYYFQKIQKVPLNTSLWAEAFYDNTSGNPYNPNSPPQNVSLGEGTSDEMLLVYFAFTFYQPGDENIILDSNIVLGTKGYLYKDFELFPLHPNPAENEVLIKLYTENRTSLHFEILSTDGRVVHQWIKKNTQGYITEKMNISALPSGYYHLRVSSGKGIKNLSFIKK